MNKNLGSIFTVATILCVLSYAVLAMAPMPPTIAKTSNKINIELSNMDLAIANAAQQLTQTTLNDKDTLNILKNLYNNYSSAVIASTVDPNGTLLLVYPIKYQSEGENISNQDHFKLIKLTNKPVMSNMFKTVEGFYSVSIMHPIFSDTNNLIGYVSLVFQPQTLIKNIIQPDLDPFPSMEALAIQLDGRIIYDRDILQVGQMTFSDPMYQNSPSLLAIANRMTSEASGSGTYTFLDKTKRNTINKTTQWDTISLYQTQWRLIFAF